MINSTIFRQYDIRGIWGKDLTADVSNIIGKAFGTNILSMGKKETVAVSVGRDIRLSSQTICENLIRGLLSTGVDVFDIGECPTPIQY